MPNQQHITPLDEAELRTKVAAIDADLVEVKGAFETLRKHVDAQFGQVYAKVEGGFERLTAKIDARAEPKWGVIYSGIGVLLTFCLAVGALAYAPIRASIDDLKGDAKQIVPRVEHEGRTRAVDDRFDRLELRLTRIEDHRYQEMREEVRELRALRGR